MTPRATWPAASAAGSAATDGRRTTGAPHRTQTSVAPAHSAPHSAHLILHRQARLPIVVAADPDASDHGSLWRLTSGSENGMAAQARRRWRSSCCRGLGRAPEHRGRPTGPGHRGDRRHPRQQIPGRDSGNSVGLAPHPPRAWLLAGPRHALQPSRSGSSAGPATPASSWSSGRKSPSDAAQAPDRQRAGLRDQPSPSNSATATSGFPPHHHPAGA